MQRTDFQEDAEEFMDDLLCEVLAGPPGSGKSTVMKAAAVAEPKPYLIAAPRIDLAEEIAQDVLARVQTLPAGDRPVVTVIHSGQRSKNGDGVDRRLRDALNGAVSPHTIIITTHAGLMGLAPDDFAGWHIRIDELPDTAVVSGVVGLGASWRTLAALYSLVPTKERGWFKMVLRDDIEAPGLHQIRSDVSAPLVEMYRLATSRGRAVEVHMAAWQDIAAWEDAGVSGTEVHWRSIWSLADLKGCASLQVAAAGYAGSLIDHATRRAGGVRIEAVKVGAPRTGQPAIRVHYYTKHTGSTTWWGTNEGSACLAAIGAYLGTIGFDGYWTANKVAAPYLRHRAKGEEIAPRSAGTNALRGHTSCALIFSAKATKADEAVMAALKIDRAAIRIAREDEDLIQAATRGAIRDPAYAGAYEIHLYSLDQAERLQVRLKDAGYKDVTLVPVPEAGVMDVVRPVAARRGKVTDEPVETVAARRERKRLREQERGRRRRKADRDARIQAGTHRGRGRPRRVSSSV